jgi:hypothetical protein
MYGKHEMRSTYDKKSKRMIYKGAALGGGRAMTERTNTSISALGAIFLDDSTAKIGLNIHHNHFARLRLPVSWLRGSTVRHFELSLQHENGQIPAWREATQDDAGG